MTDRNAEPPVNLPERSASRMIRMMVRSWKVWVALLAIALGTAVLPGAAKVPVALAVGVVFLAPVLRELRDPAVTAAIQSGRAHDPTQQVEFAAHASSSRRQGRPKWRQLHCTLRGSALHTQSYWRWSRTPAEIISIKSAKITSVTASQIRRDGLKTDLYRIIDLQLAHSASLRLAVDREVADTVQAAIEAHARTL